MAFQQGRQPTAGLRQAADPQQSPAEATGPHRPPAPHPAQAVILLPEAVPHLHPEVVQATLHHQGAVLQAAIPEEDQAVAEAHPAVRPEVEREAAEAEEGNPSGTTASTLRI